MCVLSRSLQRESDVCWLLPPIYTHTSPFECVGLTLLEVSHSLDQSESCSQSMEVCQSATWPVVVFRDNSRCEEQVEDWRRWRETTTSE